MTPEQFIREWDLEKAREVVAASANALVQCSDGTTFHVNDLKRLVESLDLVKKLGGLQGAKAYVPEGYKSDRLKQAIADHESIYGGE
ncbi:hypothetical protein [Acinetobacter nosocomialis]|uniref:hypothetical protein n=1 Tax=Acinetobacter nosocomialis TaxID=106654 RepID=UPI001B8282B1|nr:hypothetical protein [Acinetobacter nosocomialis]MBR7715506.1 hypothetical protein [Acinetobacter nosocomialis]